jgi:hypothetical protein
MHMTRTWQYLGVCAALLALRAALLALRAALLALRAALLALCAALLALRAALLALLTCMDMAWTCQYFDELRCLLPCGADSKFDKNTILQNTIAMIKQLQVLTI